MPPAAKSLARGLPRSVATFEFYYSEPYNAVTQPHRFDWYLITRWLPELGPDGFAIVKVLRSLCYWNPKDGSLRDTWPSRPRSGTRCCRRPGPARSRR